jgi:hypothetical protein
MSFGPPGGPPKGAAPGALSRETRELLGGMMAERGMSGRLRRDILGAAETGDAAWTEHWGSRQCSGNEALRGRAPPKVRAPKVGRRGYEALAMAPPPSSGRKPLKNILREGAWEPEAYTGQGTRGIDLDGEKRRLQESFHFAKMSPSERAAAKAAGSARAAARQAAAEAKRAPPSAAEVREELIDQLVQEVQERQDFLEAMQRGGKGAQYENQIKAEVSERLHRLKELGLG